MNTLRLGAIVWLGGIALALCGCQKDAAPASGVPQAGETTSESPREKWDLLLLRGHRMGQAVTRFTPIERGGKKLLKVDTTLETKGIQQGRTIEQRVSCTSLETPEGELVAFDSTVQQGPSPMKASGQVTDGELRMEITLAGKTDRRRLRWSPEYGGFSAPERSLLRQPLEPGESRTIRSIAMPIYELASIELVAGKYETVDVRGARYNLLRIESTTRFADGKTLEMTLWCDRTGEIVKTLTAGADLETVRVSKAEAMEKYEPGSFDLLNDLLVRLDRPLPKGHAARRARYRVHLEGGDPAAVFPAATGQTVKSLDAHTAEITVSAVRADSPVPPSGNDKPTATESRSTTFAQSDDPRVVERANEAAGDETDPWQTALKLEQYVQRVMKKKSQTSAFASAAEVAKDPAGDCTEHAVLLVAMARARGLPARAVMGMVYVDSRQAFGFHMWAEIYIRDRWVPMDGTLARGGIGAGHLTLGHTDLDGSTVYLSITPVLKVLGKLKIDLIDAE